VSARLEAGAIAGGGEADLGKATSVHFSAQFGSGVGLVAGVFAPGEIEGVEVAAGDAGGGVKGEAVIDKAGEGVLVEAIFGGGGLDDGWGLDAKTLPLEAASDGPGENAREFEGEFCRGGEGRVLLRDGDLEGEEVDALPDSLTGAADLGTVVAVEPEFVGGEEVEVFAVEVAGGEGVTAGEVFDEGIGEGHVVIDFLGDGEADAAQAGAGTGRPDGSGGHECDVGGLAAHGLGTQCGDSVDRPSSQDRDGRGRRCD